MNKEALELQKQWTESRIKRINEEIERFKLQRKKLDKLIEGDEKEITQLQESLNKSTEEYLIGNPYETIEYFIKERGYTYSVEDVIDEYTEFKKTKCYMSYTMSDCIRNLKKPLELISNKNKGRVQN